MLFRQTLWDLHALGTRKELLTSFHKDPVIDHLPEKVVHENNGSLFQSIQSPCVR